MQDYRIQLDTYSGPMDLLLYLIRREEVDIYDIPIARVLEQYLHYVRLLEELDPESVGDFLVMAATLMEIKSRMLLPRNLPEEGEEEDLLDPRADLVRQLLAYRSVREAAGQLGERAELHLRRFGRPRVDGPADNGDVDIEDFAQLQLCITTGLETPPSLTADCRCFDQGADNNQGPEHDNDIDEFDLSAFIACISGPGVPADKACDGN